MQRSSTIKKIRETLLKTVPDAKVILYGSQARGDARPESDIDLLVLLNSDKPRASWHDAEVITESLYDIELEDGVTVSPLVYTKRQWKERPFLTPFYVNVVNEGKPLW